MSELLQVSTSDGLQLHGLLELASQSGGPTGTGAVLCIHGSGSNFYSSRLFQELSRSFLDHGSAVLRANTRGHDWISLAASERGSRRAGAAFEEVDHCRYDLLAWIQCLRDRGYASILVVGHSLGALKALYTLSRHPQPAVQGVVAVSPPRLSCSYFQQSLAAVDFKATLAEAEQHIAVGRGDALMDVRFPIPLIISAAGYVDKYGPSERYDVLKFAHLLKCPTLVTFGSLEVEKEVAFQGLPVAIQALAPPDAGLCVEVIADANHQYTGKVDVLSQCISQWLP